MDRAKNMTAAAVILWVAFIALLFFVNRGRIHFPPSRQLAQVGATFASEVWVSPRTDDVPGTGTETDPYDGSTAEKFDALMRSFPENTTIDLSSGLFLTTGSAAYNIEHGWVVKDGWKVRGRGKDLTTVRQVSFPTTTGGNGHGVFQMSIFARGGAEVSGMTVDDNWQNLGASPADTTFAVSLRGNNNIIRGVRAMNGYGNLASRLESFELTISSRYEGTQLENSVNALIEDCDVVSYRGDYGYAIGLIGSPGLSGSIQGIVRNNTVTGFVGTAAFALSGNTIFEGNRTSGNHKDYYIDTGLSENTIFRNNQLMDTAIGIHISPTLGVAIARNILIEGNTIEINGTVPALAIGIALSGTVGVSHQSDITIRGNTFTKKSTGSATDFIAIAAADVDGLRVENNIVDPTLRSMANWPEYPSTRVVVSGNKTTTGGVPLGLEDFPSIVAPVPDTTAPVISNIETNISASRVIVNWVTNESSDSQVEYGPSSSYGNLAPLNTALVTAHAVVLSGLQSNTVYNFRTISKDAAGNQVKSANATFLTPATVIPDVVPPVVPPPVIPPPTQLPVVTPPPAHTPAQTIIPLPPAAPPAHVNPTLPRTPQTTPRPSVTTIVRNLKLGDKGEDVLLLQKTLNALGYIVAKEGTTFDVNTQNALARYQKDNSAAGLRSTGALDNVTLLLLDKDIKDLDASNGAGGNNANTSTSTLSQIGRSLDSFLAFLRSINNFFVDLIKSLF